MGNMIGICSGKGGVGKSTVCTMLGLALGKRGKRVLLVDMDRGLGSLGHMLGIEGKIVYNIGDALSGKCPMMKAIYPLETVQNVFVMACDEGMGDGLDRRKVACLLRTLSEFYDFILVDSPAGLGKDFYHAMEAADRIFIVGNIHPLSIQAIKKVRIALLHNGVKDIRLILNRFSYKGFWRSGFYADLDEVIDEAGTRLIGIIPEDSSAATQLMKGAMPDTGSRMEKAFRRLAERVEGKNVCLPKWNRI